MRRATRFRRPTEETKALHADSTDVATDLVRIRAALAAGMSPVEALNTAKHTAVRDIAAAVRLGGNLTGQADKHPEVDVGVQLLLRALAVAERAGSGGSTGVEQALTAIRETRGTHRLLRIKTAQARGTATLMAVVPVAAWLLLVGFDGAAIRFYTTPPGMVTGLIAVLGMWAGRQWSQRLVERAAQAADMADPLQPRPPGMDLRRAVVVGVPVALMLAMPAGVVAGAFIGLAVGAAAARPRRTAGVDLHGGGTPEAVELLALALSSGLSVVAAVGVVAEMGPPASREHLTRAHRRLEAGWTPAGAFDRTPLASLGDLLEAVDRWGAPAAPTLRGYAEELRAVRRVAAEEAAERTQLALVFPTTLLTLPAFALAIVPPLVWIGFGDGIGVNAS